MKKILLITLLIIVSSIIIYLFVNDVLFEKSKKSELENYTTQIINLDPKILGKGNRGLGKCAVPLWMVINYLFTVDEQQNVYMLDIYKNRIIHLTSTGKLLKEIALKNITFNNFPCEGDGCPLIQSSAQGDLFYLKSEDLRNVILYNYGGEPNKKKASPGCLDRVCEGTFKGTFRTSFNEIWDNNLNIIDKFNANMNRGYYDLQSNLYTLDGPDKLVLIKRDLEGRKIWSKKISGYKKAISILGNDSVGNIYVLLDNPDGIVKISKEGIIVAKIAFPSNLRGTFQVLCDGTIYGFPNHVDIKSGKAQKDEGKYVIYKFVKR